MPGDPIDFAAIIEQDREQRQKLEWQGTLLQYLDLIKARPGLIDLAHKRMYDMLVAPGVTEVDVEADPRAKRVFGDESAKVYNFFKDEFFGMERTLEKIVRYFHSAAMGGEEARQVLYLMGPVGSGKSSLVERLKRGLEDLDPIHVIEGCPIFEQPLHLIPRHLRKAFEDMLGVRIEGDLCPVCRWRLINEHDGKYENVPIKTISFSKRARRGIGVVPPVDPNNQDTSVLIGSEDISKLDRYSEGDPRVLELNGAFNVGNRGMVEFIEVFKNETEYLHTMITATQEKFVPAPGRHGTIYVDTCIVAHSNEAEWQKFKADHTNEAILDRIVVVKVPYNLRLTEEVKIYKRFLERSKFNAQIAPHTLEVASKCDFELDWSSMYLPQYPGLRPGESADSRFRDECEKGLAKRYGDDWRNVVINGVMLGLTRKEIERKLPAIVDRYLGSAEFGESEIALEKSSIALSCCRRA